MKKALTHTLIALTLGFSLSGCAVASRVLNPFSEPPAPEAFLGSPNDHALNDSKEKSDTARGALEHMASYQRARAPQPNNPVIQPAIVRLMWVPDHVNKHGDLVPGHYYYLKVLKDRWTVQDSFELEEQLGGGTSASSGLPFVTTK